MKKIEFAKGLLTRIRATQQFQDCYIGINLDTKKIEFVGYAIENTVVEWKDDIYDRYGQPLPVTKVNRAVKFPFERYSRADIVDLLENHLNDSKYMYTVGHALNGYDLNYEHYLNKHGV